MLYVSGDRGEDRALQIFNFFLLFGNVYKNSELAFSAVDKEKADKKEIKYL